MDIYEIKVGQTVRFKRPEDKASQTGVVRSIDRISGTVSVEVPPTRGVVRVVVTFVESVVAASAPRMVECKKSKHHGFYREDKACELCPPPPLVVSNGVAPWDVSYSFVANIAAGLGFSYAEQTNPKLLTNLVVVVLIAPNGSVAFRSYCPVVDIQLVRQNILENHLGYKRGTP